ncbi:cre-like putative Phage integrase (plasmid) [Methylobacterium aquaticum]|uniref:Cre-like putative Phage integrase n=1 Tax=Methylobacterium aquaticum TaxID=270351 RepID=A0A0C6FBE0_9HYPH|nr:cre-like putative Phage integrase [Methylobacterium aquaticum]
MAGICQSHRAGGLPNLCADEIVRLTVKRMNRTRGRRQKQAEPLNRTSIVMTHGVFLGTCVRRPVTSGMSGG